MTAVECTVADASTPRSQPAHRTAAPAQRQRPSLAAARASLSGLASQIRRHSGDTYAASHRFFSGTRAILQPKSTSMSAVAESLPRPWPLHAGLNASICGACVIQQAAGLAHAAKDTCLCHGMQAAGSTPPPRTCRRTRSPRSSSSGAPQPPRALPSLATHARRILQRPPLRSMPLLPSTAAAGTPPTRPAAATAPAAARPRRPWRCPRGTSASRAAPAGASTTAAPHQAQAPALRGSRPATHGNSTSQLWKTRCADFLPCVLP